jgi:hypothetical protein
LTRHVGPAGKTAGFLGTFLPLASRIGLFVHLGVREPRLIASVLFFPKEDIFAFVDQNTLQRHIKPFSSTPTAYSLHVCVHRTREYFARQQRLRVHILKRTTVLSAEWRSGSAVSDIQPLAFTDYTNKLHSRAHRTPYDTRRTKDRNLLQLLQSLFLHI